MATPDGWKPGQSSDLIRGDIRDEPGRCMRLVVEETLETWIDFTNGRIIQGLPHRDTAAAESDAQPTLSAPAQADTLASIVISALAERDWEHEMLNERFIWLPAGTAHCRYNVVLTVDDDRHVVGCQCLYSGEAPERSRVAVAEAMARVNWGLAIGGFKLDFSDGEMHFRASIDSTGGRLLPAMVHNLIATATEATEYYDAALMAVAFAGANPSAAIAKAKRAT